MAEMMAPFVIKIDGVGKDYATKQALKDIDLVIAPGECLALLGHNGAGKTTLVKIMLGLTRPTQGRIAIGLADCDDLYSMSWRNRLGYLPENVAFDGGMSGKETLRFYGRLKHCPPEECDRMLDRVGLGDDGGRRIRTYSKGMRQRLGLAQALLGQPALLFLDEPTSGLDPLSRRLFYELIAERVAAGTTVVISSHSLHEIEGQVNRFALLQDGHLRASGTLAQLQEQAKIRTRIRLRVDPGMASQVAEQLQQGTCFDRINDRAIDLSCAPADKMAVLRDLSRLGSVVRDVEISPPTLEDIYVQLTRTE